MSRESISRPCQVESTHSPEIGLAEATTKLSHEIFSEPLHELCAIFSACFSLLLVFTDTELPRLVIALVAAGSRDSLTLLEGLSKRHSIDTKKIRKHATAMVKAHASPRKKWTLHAGAGRRQKRAERLPNQKRGHSFSGPPNTNEVSLKENK